MCTIDGVKRSCPEMAVAENISAYANAKGLNVKELLLNKNSDELMEFLDFPETFDVKGPDLLDFCRERTSKFLGFIDITKYIESTVVNPKLFTFDIVATYSRKDPVFIELNDFYHYKVISGLNTYEELARNLVTDFAKKKLIEMSGYSLVEIPTMGRSKKEYLEDVYKVI